jgi:small subunit ribosomal protein S17
MESQINKANQTATHQVIKRKFNGVVISDKMNKTRVVTVVSVKIYPKYQKRYKVSKKFKVHDEKNQTKIGDKVNFIECRPLSKDKKWRMIY